jgi:hypothetical protein
MIVNIPIPALLFSSLIMMGNLSCGNSTSNEKILAQVGNEYLYANALPTFNSDNDSIDFVKKYTDNWINNQILIQHAAQYTNASDEAIDQKVEKFRQDLLLANYEKNLIETKLDTTVTSQQINEFYTENKPLFELRDFVVNVFYMKFDISEKNNVKIGNEIKNCKSFDDAKKIDDKYASLSVNSFLEPNSWIFLTDLLREIPINIDDKSTFLEKNNFYQTQTEEDIYYVRIFDYKLKNETSPVNLVENKIKTLILRERSRKLIESNRNSIIKQFNQKNEVQNYTK